MVSDPIPLSYLKAQHRLLHQQCWFLQWLLWPLRIQQGPFWHIGLGPQTGSLLGVCLIRGGGSSYHFYRTRARQPIQCANKYINSKYFYTLCKCIWHRVAAATAPTHLVISSRAKTDEKWEVCDHISQHVYFQIKAKNSGTPTLD